MADRVSRRSFLTAAATTVAVGGRAADALSQGTPSAAASAPVVISSANGLPATAKAAELIRSGADALDAAIAGVNIVEADPDDHSVGLGGLPNEEGVVQLDASVMHGPTHNCGAVAAIERIVHPSRVAKLVMERTDHALIVGEGALRFAKAHGFKEQELLTDEARRMWLRWKEQLSNSDDWLGPIDDDEQSRRDSEIMHTYGTIHCSALDMRGGVSGVTTTSGLSYKIPGRVGDSPIIGAGLYVDDEVGAAGSTGRGEAVIKSCASHAVVEMMRGGMAPADACVNVLKRLVSHVRDPRLLNEEKRPRFDVKMYALSRDGRFGAASIWSGARFSVYAGGSNRLEDCAYLFKRPS